MKVSYSEGLATRADSESCIFVRKGASEALTGGDEQARYGAAKLNHHRASGGHSRVPTLLN